MNCTSCDVGQMPLTDDTGLITHVSRPKVSHAKHCAASTPCSFTHLHQRERCPEQHFGALHHDAVPHACGCLRGQCSGKHAAEPLPCQACQAAFQPVENLKQARVFALHQNIKHALLHITARSSLQQMSCQSDQKQERMANTPSLSYDTVIDDELEGNFLNNF